jgi:hypothetical protein
VTPVRIYAPAMVRRLRLTRVGWLFVAAFVITALLVALVPDIGLIAVIVLTLAVLAALSEGVLGDSSGQATHEAWASVEAERKREALQRRDRSLPPR